jgi:uncharacterized protein GlcG (DUF336 family)
MSGATPLSSGAAEAKAYSAAMLMREGDQVAALAANHPGVFDALKALTRLPLVPAGGSIPIVREGRVVGAVGVSGAPEDIDASCAGAGVAALHDERPA